MTSADQQKGESLEFRTRTKKVRLQTMIPEELFKQIQVTALQNSTSVSEVAYRILDRYYRE